MQKKKAPLGEMDNIPGFIISSIKGYALYTVNLDGNITYFGKSSEVMFGWKEDEIISKHVSVLHVKEDVATTPFPILEQIRKLGQYETEMYLARKDGQPFPVALNANKLLGANEESIGYLFIAKDITERKKTDCQVFQKEKIAAIRQFTIGLVDEMSNILIAISGRIKVLLEQGSTDENVKQNLEVVNNCTDRLSKVVKRISKFATDTPYKFENLNINEIIESVLTLLNYHKEHTAAISIEKDLAEGLPFVRGDFKQLQEVFLNLFLNACQAMAGSGKLNIKTSNYQDHYIEIKISDTRYEISNENSKTIITPALSKENQPIDLDLLICYKVIDNFNGSINIDSQNNDSITFIRLPLFKNQVSNRSSM